jgi:hypothetical protein
MRPSTAAALVGAGALSTIAGPLHGLRMRRIAAEQRDVIASEEEAALVVPVGAMTPPPESQAPAS